MHYQLNYEANVCHVSLVPSRQSLVNALSTELWSKCVSCLYRPIKTVCGKFPINWTMKQKSALSPSSNQDSLWWMSCQLNYEANVCLVSFVSSRILYEMNFKANVCLFTGSHQDSLWWMLNLLLLLLAISVLSKFCFKHLPDLFLTYCRGLWYGILFSFGIKHKLG